MLSAKSYEKMIHLELKKTLTIKEPMKSFTMNVFVWIHVKSKTKNRNSILNKKYILCKLKKSVKGRGSGCKWLIFSNMHVWVRANRRRSMLYLLLQVSWWFSNDFLAAVVASLPEYWVRVLWKRQVACRCVIFTYVLVIGTVQLD